MEWLKARELIEKEITEGTDLNTDKSHGRSVVRRSEEGFAVRIGKRNHIEIPWNMLETCFEPLRSDGRYDGVYFRRHYSKQAKDHPCYVHVVGQIFVKAGIAVPVFNCYFCS